MLVEMDFPTVLRAHYEVGEELARGTGGCLFRARDARLDRVVAIKEPLALSPEIERRFLQEALLTARLQHPSIVPIHEIGRWPTGEPFYAMKLVAGRSLRDVVAEAKTLEERLALVPSVLAVADAIAYAHSEGVVHGDLTLANVMIGAFGETQVLDWGRATDLRGRDGPAGDVERTDVVGIGGILQEVLAGDWRVPPELLAIAGHAMASEPAGRYSGARELADDLRRFASGQLVRAYKYSIGWRLWRFVKRSRRVLVAVATSLAVGPVAAFALAHGRLPPPCPSAESLLVHAWDASRRTEVEAAFRATKLPYAEDAIRGTLRALDDYAQGWLAMRHEACLETRVRARQSSELLDLRMECLNARLSGLRALTGGFAHADAAVVEHAVQGARGLTPLADCAALAALRAPLREPSEPSIRAQIEAVRDKIAESHATRYTAKPGDAVPLARRLVTDAHALAYLPLEAEALENEGALLDLADDLSGAVLGTKDAQLAAVAGNHPSIETLAWIDLTHALGRDTRLAEARVAAKYARACLERDGNDQERLATLLVNEAIVASQDGEYEEALGEANEALSIREKHLAPDDPEIAASLNQLGVVLWRKGDLDASLAAHQRALAIRAKAFGPRHPLVAASLGNISLSLSSKGNDEAALGMMSQALEIQSAAFGPETRVVADTLNNMSLSLAYLDRNLEALEANDRVIAIRLKVLGSEHPDVAVAYGNRAVVLLALARWDDAIASAKRRLDIQGKANGPDYPPLARPLLQIGKAYLGKGDPATAIVSLERALKVGGSGGIPPNVVAQVREALATALQAAHRDPARVDDLTAKARDAYESEGAEGDLARLNRAFPTPARLIRP
jgi:tetratricopeptide (TPR) repeat protein